MLSIVIMLSSETKSRTLEGMTTTPLALLLPDVRSAQNVGAILRTADAVGVSLVIMSGYTPHPWYAGDPRPPHVSDSNTRAIAKTALGAEATVPFRYIATPEAAITYLHHNHYKIAALEQSETSTNLFEYHADGPLALILGNEVDGVPASVLDQADVTLELPMQGQKESLNVAVAAGNAMYQLRYGHAA